jgi:uncharacterized NAD(P)/FAD-binding protein YdhS
MTDGVVIVGGGASGTLTAVSLARFPELGPITVVDAAGAFARGVAYSTEEPVHLLNVPAARMSAIPEEPSQLLVWLGARGESPDPEAFIQRRLYGTYLGELLRAADGQVTRRLDRATALVADGDRVRVELASGSPLVARGVVLAMGNFAPELPPGWTDLPARMGWRTPWAARGEWPAPDAEVLLLGAALTAADVVLSLDARGHKGRIHLLSRRGLFPATHPPRMSASLPLGPRPARLRELLRMFREASERHDSRAVLDTLRPELGALWRGLTHVEQRRFLRHLRTWFDTVRHRVAPEVGARISEMEAEGRIVRHAGRVVSISEQDGKVAVRYRPRGARALALLSVDVAIPTTGPVMDVRALDEPLVRSLLATGQALPGPHGLGFATAADGSVLGTMQDRLWTLGGLRRGDLWESTAIPEISVQARALGDAVATRLRTAGGG